jgi:hypothetical protein
MDTASARRHDQDLMRFHQLLWGIGLGVSLSACFADDTWQRLDAEGTVLDTEGAPLAAAEIDAYVVYFQVADGTEIKRRFVEDSSSPLGIHTDSAGRFKVTAPNLALSYDWQRDEYVCEDICTLWETTCNTVTEEVCVQQCETVTYDACWDECESVCVTSCYDDTYCDEDGNCWTETVCGEECSPSCVTVCGPVTEDQCYDECWDETYDVCEDVCIESVEECAWVTRTYTSYPALSEVVAARSEIVLRDATGESHTVAGEAVVSKQKQQCDGERCEPLNVWQQQDNFVVPYAP